MIIVANCGSLGVFQESFFVQKNACICSLAWIKILPTMLKRKKYLIMELLFYTDLLVSACSLIIPPRNFLAIKRQNGTFSVHFQFCFYLPLDYCENVQKSAFTW